MIRTNITSIIIVSFIAFSLLIFALPENGVASELEGCCVIEATDTCGGCNGCAVSFEHCELIDGSPQEGGVCNVGAQGAGCDGRINQPGCCAISAGQCIENIGSRDCFDDVDGIIWNPGGSCEEIPTCSEPTNVPSLNQWGLIALAALIGVVGLIMTIRSRKATV